MAVFVVNLDNGEFVLRGENIRRLGEAIDFYLFARTREDAKQIAVRYIGEKIGHSSTDPNRAIFDHVEERLKRAEQSEYLRSVESIIAEASVFIGTIAVDDFIIASPEHEADILIVGLSEESRRRTLIESIYSIEDGSIEWRDDMTTFDTMTVSKEMQKLF